MQACRKVATIKSHGRNLRQVLHVHGKLTFKHVKGGVILIDTDYTIKEEKLLKKH